MHHRDELAPLSDCQRQQLTYIDFYQWLCSWCVKRQFIHNSNFYYKLLYSVKLCSVKVQHPKTLFLVGLKCTGCREYGQFNVSHILQHTAPHELASCNARNIRTRATKQHSSTCPLLLLYLKSYQRFGSSTHIYFLCPCLWSSTKVSNFTKHDFNWAEGYHPPWLQTKQAGIDPSPSFL